MFGVLLGALGPAGWISGVATAATVAYAFLDDDNDYSTYEDMTAAAEKEEVLKRNQQIYEEIERYKAEQIKRMKEKYNVEISFKNIFNNGLASVWNMPIQSSIHIKYNYDMSDGIIKLEKETNELVQLIRELEAMKNETIG